MCQSNVSRSVVKDVNGRAETEIQTLSGSVFFEAWGVASKVLAGGLPGSTHLIRKRLHVSIRRRQ